MCQIHLPKLTAPKHRLQAADMLASGRNPRTGAPLSAAMLTALEKALRS